MRKKRFGLLFAFVFVFLLGFFNISSSAQEEQAEGMVFSYVFKSGTKNTINSKLTIEEENVRESKDLKISEEENTRLVFQAFNNSFFVNEDTNVFENELVNIKVNTSFETNSIELKNDLDEVIASTTGTTLIEYLQDGTYTLTYVGIIEWIEIRNNIEIGRKSMVTATIPIVVHKTTPEGRFIKLRDNNFVYFTWENKNWTATLDENPYTPDTWIQEEGLHKIILTNGTIYKQYETYIDHHFKETSKENPTCEQDGKIIKTCSQCGEVQTELLPKTEHRFIEEIKTPTCLEMGGTLRKCEVCGKEDMTNLSSPLGHQYTEEQVEATCTENGGILHTCVLCGNSYMTDVIYPSGHSMTSEIIKNPTCEEGGSRRHVCVNCDLEFVTDIPATNHNYELSSEENNDGLITRVYTCKSCGETYVQNLGNQYEKVTNYVVFLVDSYSPYMVWILLATVGIWSLALGIPIILAHRNEEKLKAKRMLITYVVGLVVIFAILVACPFLVRGIAYLVVH